jgi:adenosylmethionine-8-amino-7-oxononanoate aminotransferase
LDKEHVWHPFTQMREWLRTKSIVIVEGKGAMVRDAEGKKYLDANSSIWTNLHGHGHPRLNRAIRKQLGKIAHSSALGLANEPASLLAAKLVRAAEVPCPSGTRKRVDGKTRLEKVFFSDDGSTAMEVALKLAYEAKRRERGGRPRFVSMQGGYHGDTIGAVALGHIDLFHQSFAGLLFKTDKVPAPYCYRCPYNRAKPERADAREYRRCKWECLDKVEQRFEKGAKKGAGYAGFVFEPLIQGAAGIIAQPKGWLKQAGDIARGHGAFLIADEVMTGFGRTGVEKQPVKGGVNGGSLFACSKEQTEPDFMAVAKGLTGGYLPMAATLTTRKVFEAFLGEYEEFRTFFHGHSFTGNQLGSAAALANLEELESAECVEARQRLENDLREELKRLWELRQVGDVRQVGLVAGVELVRDWRTREAFNLTERAGLRVCEAMARRGVLTRPIGNVVVLMPPYCTTRNQLRKMVTALYEAILEVESTGTGSRGGTGC